MLGVLTYFFACDINMPVPVLEKPVIETIDQLHLLLCAILFSNPLRKINKTKSDTYVYQDPVIDVNMVMKILIISEVFYNRKEKYYSR